MVTRPAALALLLLLPGCSTFDRDFAQATRQPPTTQPSEVFVGAWQGDWRSSASGHTGALRCLVTAEPPASSDPAAPKRYRARFHARYAGIFTFEYTAMLEGRTTDGRCRMHGEENLGWLAGGIYRYAGQSDGRTFTATYSSNDDQGVFELARPAPPVTLAGSPRP